MENLSALLPPPPAAPPPPPPHLSSYLDLAPIGVYSPKSAIHPANPKSMRFFWMSSLYLFQAVIATGCHQILAVLMQLQSWGTSITSTVATSKCP